MIQSRGFVSNILDAFFDPDKTIEKVINKTDELYLKKSHLMMY